MYGISIISIVLSGLLPLTKATLSTTCANRIINSPSIPGTEILSISSIQVSNYSISVTGQNAFPVNLTNLEFCNVTVQYTHPGQNDRITTQIWLPLKGWTGRFLGAGGGGWATGNFNNLAVPVSLGFATAGTDGGHSITSPSPNSWGQISPGNVNLYLLQDFASVALNEIGLFGKAVTTSFYSTAPKYSYWNGCSTGGRQGLMLAQRYPETFDGILASAPAINWQKFIVAEYWPQLVMNLLGVYPTQCELDGIIAAAVASCDGLDGVVDGIISAPKLCRFDTSTVVGKSAKCADGTSVTISEGAAKVVKSTWNGPYSPEGKQLWYGLLPGANLGGLVGTTCNGTSCTGSPFSTSADYIRVFLAKNVNFDLKALSLEQYSDLFKISIQEYTSIIGTDDPDLSRFRRAGGKMITWHGLDDNLIFPDGTAQYYDRVEKLDPKVRDFYRYFEVPGVQHCRGGDGPYPSESLDELIRWVENGKAPQTLKAISSPTSTGPVKRRNLCQYPLVSVFLGGRRDPFAAESYECRRSFRTGR